MVGGSRYPHSVECAPELMDSDCVSFKVVTRNSAVERVDAVDVSILKRNGVGLDFGKSHIVL